MNNQKQSIMNSTLNIEKELKEIKQELKALNQSLAAMAEIMEDYMYARGIYSKGEVNLTAGQYGIKRGRGFSKKK